MYTITHSLSEKLRHDLAVTACRCLDSDVPSSISRAPNMDRKEHTVSLKGIVVEGKMGRKLTKPRKHISVRHGVAHATSGYLMALAVQLTAVAAASQASAGITAWTTQSTRFMTIRQLNKGCRSCGWFWACEKSGRRKRERVCASAGVDGLPENGDVNFNGVGGRDAYDVNPDAKEISGASSAHPDTEDDNYYTLLGLTVGASPENIKNAYRQLIRRVHPDADGTEASKAQFQALTQAYEVLSDPGKRSTYDQGLVMRRFVDKVKTGNWTKTLAAVASLGAAATSVGVFAGIKAAEPLAKDIARGLKDVAGAGMQAITQDLDSISREERSIQKAKAESERKLSLLRKKCEEALEEARAADEAQQLRLMEQQKWNSTLMDSEQEMLVAKAALVDIRGLVDAATKVATELKAKETEATEAMRKAIATREALGQASVGATRGVSSAKAAVASAEQRVAEAQKALEDARRGLEAAQQQEATVESQRDEILTQERLARDKLVAARKVNTDTGADLMEKQTRKSRLQADLKAKGRELGLAVAKVKELGDAAEAARTRALRLRRSAQDSEDVAKDEEMAIEAAKLQESRLQVQAAAMKAEAEAAAAAAEEEKAQREREEAAMAAKQALERARAAEEAAGAAKAAAVAAAEAARRATADAQALVRETEGELAEPGSLSNNEHFVDPSSKPERLARPETEAKKESQSGTVAMLDT